MYKSKLVANIDIVHPSLIKDSQKDEARGLLEIDPINGLSYYRCYY